MNFHKIVAEYSNLKDIFEELARSEIIRHRSNNNSHKTYLRSTTNEIYYIVFQYIFIKDKNYPLLFNNTVFLLIDMVGIYRWFF